MARLALILMMMAGTDTPVTVEVKVNSSLDEWNENENDEGRCGNVSFCLKKALIVRKSTRRIVVV
jgi:hypothetical protein